MTVTQRETLLQTAIMIEAGAKVIESKIFTDDDTVVETLEITVENLEHQLKDMKEVLTNLKQSQL